MRLPSLPRRALPGFGLAAAAASAEPRLVLNDASRLSPTPGFSHWVARGDTEAGIIARLRAELAAARQAGRPLVVSAARHSMGGQSLPRDGHAITANGCVVEADTAARLYRASAGSRWHEVITWLDPLGFSPAVMQSNSDFGLGATFAVNAHGWPAPYGPFGSTVQSIRLMLADGEITDCSRTREPALFALAMGGYGLCGIILDLTVSMVPNAFMQPSVAVMPAADFAPRFVAAARGGATMLYGRLNISRPFFFQEATLVTFAPTPMPEGGLPGLDRSGGRYSGLLRRLYRAQPGLEGVKQLRWLAERSLAPAIGLGAGTRNNLMNEPALNLENRDPHRTDILHEYFVPPDRFDDFLALCRQVIPASPLEFLNVTLRWVERDETPVLTWSGTDRIAAVMSFSQRLNGEDEAAMMRLTEALVEGVIGMGGSFYLPYRLHARREQFRRAYPRADAFAAAKRRLDPRGVFRHALWDTWLAG